ncbi:hypothetical protein [Kitasatospora sp. HPMI-4]|uniref:hypothetical protein n=1 Tax=Kitasatospora sp. HPMI-4 TaxID=3448443 RepID=UPI003F1B03EE
MKRFVLAVAAAGLAAGLFGVTTQPASAIARDCIPGGPIGKCLWDGGNTGSGFASEDPCQTAADRYNGQDPDHDYECEDVFGNGRYWVVRY